MAKEWIRGSLGRGLWLAVQEGSANGPFLGSESEEVLAILALGDGNSGELPPLPGGWLASVPCACVGAAATGLNQQVACFNEYSAACCFLAIESGGDSERAAAWLDLTARYLGDHGVLLPAPVNLAVGFLRDNLAVLSVPARVEANVSGLSAAETSVFQGMMRGDSNKEIASARGSAYSTVARQVATVFRKLGVQSRSELLAEYSWSAGEF